MIGGESSAVGRFVDVGQPRVRRCSTSSDADSVFREEDVDDVDDCDGLSMSSQPSETSHGSSTTYDARSDLRLCDLRPSSASPDYAWRNDESTRKRPLDRACSWQSDDQTFKHRQKRTVRHRTLDPTLVSVYWLARLLSFKRPPYCQSTCLCVCLFCRNFDAKYLRN